jgi:hypothetical protein
MMYLEVYSQSFICELTVVVEILRCEFPGFWCVFDYRIECLIVWSSPVASTRILG